MWPTTGVTSVPHTLPSLSETGPPTGGLENQVWVRRRLLAQAHLDETIEWGKENGVTFSPLKTEMQHFTRSRRRPKNLPTISQDGHIIEAPATLRWLGIYLDSKLKFKHHIKVRAAQAKRVAGHLRGLNRTQKGMPPFTTRRAITTVIKPTAFFGSEVWYPGPSKPAQKRREGAFTEVKTGLSEAIDAIQKAINTAIRGCLPVWKTTPNNVQLREASVFRLQLFDLMHNGSSTQ